MVNNDDKIRIAFVEDNQVFYNALKMLILENNRFNLVGFYFSAESLIYELPFIEPEIILLDLDLPGMKGTEAIAILKAKFPKLKILVLTAHDDDENIFIALRRGADGYILKKDSLETLDEKIITIVNNGASISTDVSKKLLNYLQSDSNHDYFPEIKKLSEREIEILKLISEGYINKEIADKLYYSVETIKKNIQQIFEKLNVRNRSEAIKVFIANRN